MRLLAPASPLLQLLSRLLQPLARLLLAAPPLAPPLRSRHGRYS
jgi:hypothetical protein